MEQSHKLSQFPDLTTTELEQIVGGGWWENLIRFFPSTTPKNTAFHSPKIG